MKMKSALWITTTAAFIALLIGAQAATAPLTQFVTGSLVNLILVISVMTCGLASGLTVAFISPIFAKLIGIGPLWPIIPFIMAGNCALVLVWHILGNRNIINTHVARIIALAAAAIAKFSVLYLGIVHLALPLFLDVSEQQAAVVSTMFSFPQLVTASIGGTAAVLALPVIEKVLSLRQNQAA